MTAGYFRYASVAQGQQTLIEIGIIRYRPRADSIKLSKHGITEPVVDPPVELQVILAIDTPKSTALISDHGGNFRANGCYAASLSNADYTFGTR